MKKRKIIFLIFGIILLLIITGIIILFSPRKPAETVIDSSHIIPHLLDGDIILRQGDATYSAMFSDVSLTDKRFSHLGVARIRDDEISVIHSIGNILRPNAGVRKYSLELFLRNAMSVGIFRFRHADGSLISDKSLDFINRPFDWDFDISDDSKIYCTELMHVILEDIAPEYKLTTLFLDSISKEVIPLDSISASDLFDEIFFIKIDTTRQQ